MEPLGITRACTSVPSMKRNAMMTQNQETTSRQTLSLVVAGAGAWVSMARSTAIASASAFTMSLHFQLDQLGGIGAGVARGAEISLGVLYCSAERGERHIAERVRAEVLANFLDGVIRGNQFFAPRRVYAVVAGGN